LLDSYENKKEAAWLRERIKVIGLLLIDATDTSAIEKTNLDICYLLMSFSDLYADIK